MKNDIKHNNDKYETINQRMNCVKYLFLSTEFT